MGTDYFPRLAAVSMDNQKSNSIINQQIEIALLILAPILAVFIVFIHWMVIALYSTQFSPVNPYLHWAALGIFFKATSWALAFIFVAKGDKKLFFRTELIASVYILLLNLAGYYLDGLRGLGIAFCAGYFVYLLHVYVLCKRLFSFSFSADSLGILIKFLSLLIVVFLVSKWVPNPYNYVFGILLILIISALSFKALDERIGLFEKLKSLRK
jgi:O-antigen/teichoic acid export membrane protein